MLTRRRFLGLGSLGLSAVPLRGAVPDLFAQVAATSAAANLNDHVLVIVELAGGNDGLNTVIPFEQAAYYERRPSLAIPKTEVIQLTKQIGLNPKMTALADLYQEGRLAIIQGVGYPQPDRSHFRSMEIWHTASTAARPPDTGWVGRLLDATDRRANGASLHGAVLTASMPQAFRAERTNVPVLSQIESLIGASTDPLTAALVRRSKTTARSTRTEPISFLTNQASLVYDTADLIKGAVDRYKSTVEYPPTDLGSQLRRAAQIIAGHIGAKVLFASQAGYDTHSYQAYTHPQLLEDLSTSLAAFYRDLKGLRLADQVTVMVFSEFGRRVSENASAGTDHGAASCMLLLGGRVKGGIVGQHPSFDALDDGDLVYRIDFRSVYATLLREWMGCEPEPLLGGAFPRVSLFNATV